MDVLRVRWSCGGSDGEIGWTGVNQDSTDCDKLMFGDVA